jgi:hypothetical protein
LPASQQKNKKKKKGFNEWYFDIRDNLKDYWDYKKNRVLTGLMRRAGCGYSNAVAIKTVLEKEFEEGKLTKYL